MLKKNQSSKKEYGSAVFDWYLESPQRKQPNPASSSSYLASVRARIPDIDNGRSARSIEQRPHRHRDVIILPTSGSIRTVRHESVRRGRRHTDRVPPRRSVLVVASLLVGRIIRIREKKK